MLGTDTPEEAKDRNDLYSSREARCWHSCTLPTHVEHCHMHSTLLRMISGAK